MGINEDSSLSGKWLALGLVGVGAFSVPLLGYFVTSTFMRYSGDDYCYAASLIQFGFWKSQWLSYTQILTYNGNRYALTLFSNLADLLGPRFNGFLPGIMLVLWLLGLAFLLKISFEVFSVRVLSKPVFAFWLAEILAFFTLYQTPDIAQSLYWRSGMLPYFAPVVANVLLLLGVSRSALRSWSLWSAGILAFFFSWLSGGFSETGVMFQAGLWGAIFVIIWFNRNRAGRMRYISQIMPLVIAVLVGTIIAAITLAFSPTLQDRNLPSPVLSRISKSLSMAGWNTFLFYYLMLRRKTLPMLLNLGLFMFLGLSWAPQMDKNWLSIRNVFLAWIIGAAITFLSMLPFAYVQQSYPEPRAVIIMQWIATVIVSLSGWWTGGWLKQVLLSNLKGKTNFLYNLSFLVLLFLCLFPVWESRQIYNDLPRYQKWAAFWDRRDAQLRDLARQNVHEVQVIEIDHIIPNVGDLSPDPGYWYNQCASRYYGVQSISASLPGWGEK